MTALSAGAAPEAGWAAVEARASARTAALRIGVIGCGDVSRRYADAVRRHPSLVLTAAYDRHRSRTRRLCADTATVPCTSFEGLLGRSDVDIVLNLTPAQAHEDVNAAALRAGKHVFTEKPLAMTSQGCTRLLSLAEQFGTRLAAAPVNFLGEAQQAASRLVLEGRCGRVRVVFADSNHGRIERWHPSPGGIYRAGPLCDTAVYPITLLVSMFGPVQRVTGWQRALMPLRRSLAGDDLHATGPDCVMSLLEFAQGPAVRLTANFYVEATRQRGIEFHGDDGAVALGCAQDFAARVEVADAGGAFHAVDVPLPSPHGTDWARGLVDLADAIQEGRPHAASAQQAAHVVDVICATISSADKGRPVAVSARA